MDPPMVTFYGRPAQSNRPIVVTGIPGAGKSLLWEMLKHCVYGYEFSDAWTGARDGVISKAAHALCGSPAESGHYVIVIRDPAALLSLRDATGRHVVTAHGSTYRGCGEMGLCEWWDRIKKFSHALLVRFEELALSPLRVQITIGQRFDLKFTEGRFFDQIGVKDRGSVDGETVARVKREHPEVIQVFKEMGYE